MKATAVFDVLSHWCLAAWPAYEALGKKLGPENVTLLLAPVRNGFPMCVRAEDEAWFYTRGTRAYGMTLRSDWCENETTSTLWANAAVAAAAALGGGLPDLARDTMTAAMKDGALLGRRDVAVATVSRISGIDGDRINRQVERVETGDALNSGNAALASWNCNERPSWRLENANGDFVVLQGVWHANALAACADALIADEAAYAAAGALRA